MKNKKLLFSVFAFFILALNSCEIINPDDNNNNLPSEILVSDNIEESTTWYANNTYIIEGTIRVGSELGVTITIEPGTTIKFKDGAQLDIAYWSSDYATIIANGTADKPIIFTSASPVKKAGNWDGINFFTGAVNCVFDYCEFSYGGGYDYNGNIMIENTDVSFTNCTFTNSKSSAITHKDEGRFASFTNNIIENAGLYAIETTPYAASSIGKANTYQTGLKIYIDGNKDLNYAGTYTWVNQGIPYALKTKMRVGHQNNTILIIDEGVKIQFFKDSGIELAYWSDQSAQLKINGTATNPVVLTSNSPAPQKGDWEGLYFYNGSAGSQLNFCNIEYAGDYEYFGAIALDNTGFETITMNNCTVSNSKSHAITTDNESSIDITSVLFINNNGNDYHKR